MNFTIGIVGNPNCGKTTLFNQLTGAGQRVGNWPGVTVDRKSGTYKTGAEKVEVIDLPGVYTFGIVPGMETLDEKIARDFVLSGTADVIVNIVDAANLERNFYLTAQLMEMRVPMIVAVNMIDAATQNGLEIDIQALEQQLGCPVVPLVATKGTGIVKLKEALQQAFERGQPPVANVVYQSGIESLINRICPEVETLARAKNVDPRWLAVRFIEGDEAAGELAKDFNEAGLETQIQKVEAELGEDMDILIADGRYGFANGLTRMAARRVRQVSRSTSDAIDRLVLNPWLGLPLFLGIMYTMFMFTINIGGAFIDFFDIAAGTLFVDGVKFLMTQVGAPEWMNVIVADGVGGGIQVVATFIPIIGFLYLFLSVLEDSGYMARAAFLMDRLMRVIGLPGKSFVPLIVGFGCNVPAIMATRTLDQHRDRIMTTMMSPFMSCGARLAVYALFAAAFFPVGGQNVVFALYIIGILVALGTGLILKHTLLMGETSPFVMELPAYHLPHPRDVLIHAWNRLKSFMFGAGKIIVIVVVVLSFFNSFGTDGSFGNEDSDKSMLSAVGRAIVPAFKPMGIQEDNWPATVGIFTGVFAKEAVVGTLDSLYSNIAAQSTGGNDVDENGEFSLLAGLSEAVTSISDNFAGVTDLVFDPLGIGIVESDNLQSAAVEQEVTLDTFGVITERFDGRIGAFAYMLFILLYFPCVAALGAVNREIGPRWATFAAFWTTGVAYYMAVAFYQAGTFYRHPVSSGIWIVSLSVVMVGAILFMRHLGRKLSPSSIDAAVEQTP